MHGCTRWAVSILLCLASGAVAPASEPAAPAARRVAIGPQYKAGGLHRWLWGDDYRALWTKPIEVEVLDLGTVGVACAGRARGRAADEGPRHARGGRARRHLPRRGQGPDEHPARGSARHRGVRPVQDQIAASSPSAFLVVDELMDAAGILHTKTRLVAMPDDARLGEFRQEFAGLVGQISEYPVPESDRQPRVPGSPRDPQARGLLRASRHRTRRSRRHAGVPEGTAFDLMIGDWDPHRDQWRWAKFPDQPLWQPIPTTATRPSRATTAWCRASRAPARRSSRATTPTTRTCRASPGTAASRTASCSPASADRRTRTPPRAAVRSPTR